MLRPIISTCGFYVDKLVILLKSILNLLLWGRTMVANSHEFVSLLQQCVFGPDDVLYSYDVSSLFTHVPVALTLAIVQRRLDELRDTPEDPVSNLTSLSNGGIMELLDHVLSQCFFIWDGLLYSKLRDCPWAGDFRRSWRIYSWKVWNTTSFAYLPTYPGSISGMLMTFFWSGTSSKAPYSIFSRIEHPESRYTTYR